MRLAFVLTLLLLCAPLVAQNAQGVQVGKAAQGTQSVQQVKGQQIKELPEPGKDPTFVSHVVDTQDPSRPWKFYRVPESSEAVVEVVDQAQSIEELRMAAFLAFRTQLLVELHDFLLGYQDSNFSPEVPHSGSSTNPTGNLMVPLASGVKW